MKQVCIVGAGIAGLASAIELSKLNFNVVLLEKHDLIQCDLPNFRSFNLTINYRGKISLMRLGVWEEVLVNAVPLKSRTIHAKNNSLEQSYNSKQDYVLYSIPRGKLIKILVNKASSLRNINIVSRVKDINLVDEGNKRRVFYINDGIAKEVLADFIIAADGANSHIRRKYNDIFKSEMQYFKWGYIELKLNLKDLPDGLCYAMNSLHIWPRKDFLCVGIPNNDSTISLLYLSAYSFDLEKNDVKEFIAKASDDMQTTIGTFPALETLEQCKTIGRMSSVSCKQWHMDENILLIGDAAHAFWPFYGQGMNASLRDACLLSKLLSEHSIPDSFRKLQKNRKPVTDLLAKYSKKHFYFLKNATRSSRHSAIYKLELKLSNTFPKLWFHEYNTLSNTDMDIKKAIKKFKRQKVLRLTPLYGVLLGFYYIKTLMSQPKKMA